ncbi:hypothetical protein A1F94_009149 [Pyrenophora tritici-repentis]|uniref:Uncharacterized protein n=1 Tax=Pyrenophora tritici-repentis (strain Pt-1C-BFP) TaxID=426418 RepID=B2W998_PYRTR|nr:uncharacterized protein PTRG_06556 [Pyrenophora tritici-repentis Pt-1C-BFP]EDU49476.1 predicted protein [Pyrenophora tritici-repentis Pt-1C-BFP]KAG9380254.1 hypothetical protein A1F94_009149 [Pyrenophora tritici-repentis]
MSLLCTAISAIKLWAFQQLQGQKEFYYKCVPLIIWSMTELSLAQIHSPYLFVTYTRLDEIQGSTSPGILFTEYGERQGERRDRKVTYCSTGYD